MDDTNTLRTAAPLQLLGVSRDSDFPKCLCVYFDTVPTDDEMRGFHDTLRAALAQPERFTEAELREVYAGRLGQSVATPAALAQPEPAPTPPVALPAVVDAEAPPSLTQRLQQKCSDWNTYWRAPDAHGVILSPEQAVDLLQDALGVEVEIAHPAPASASEPYPDHNVKRPTPESVVLSMKRSERESLSPEAFMALQNSAEKMAQVARDDAEYKRSQASGRERLANSVLASAPASGASTEVQAPIPQGHCHWKDCPHGADCVHAPPASASTASRVARHDAISIARMFVKAHRDHLLKCGGGVPSKIDAAYTVLAEMRSELATPTPTPAPDARKPLTEGRIYEVFSKSELCRQYSLGAVVAFARDVEADHGIASPSGAEGGER